MPDGRPPRVALVAHRLAAPSPTGIGRYYTEIVRGLAQVADPRRHHLVVASTREGAAPRWVPDGVEVRSLGGPRKVRALSWALARRPRVDRALGRPDLVHVLHPWAPVPTRAPLVATVHDLLPMLHPRWHGPLESWSFRRAVADVARRAALVVVPSARTAEVVHEHLGLAPEQLRVVWNGVGDEFRRRATPEEQVAVCARYGVEPGRYLIAVGTVSERKNLRVLLQALALVDPGLLGNVELLVAGPPGVGADAVAAEVERLGLVGRVHLAGFVPDADLPVLVGASRALVHPSQEEGFGITPLEAMAAGVPALASAVGSVPEVAGDAAVLVPPLDADAWASAITAVVTDEAHRTALVRAGDAHQARFTWTRAARETLAVHDEVLGR